MGWIFRILLLSSVGGLSLLTFANDDVLPPELQAILPKEPKTPKKKMVEVTPEKAITVESEDLLGNLPPELDAFTAADVPSQSTNSNLAPVMEAFAPHTNPGRGVVRLTANESTEKVVLGLGTGHYGMGLVFESSRLPRRYRKEFKGRDIIQISFGTMTNRLEGRISQFGLASIITEGFSRKKRSYKLRMPRSPREEVRNMALMLFSSPQSPAGWSDEDRLKGTYFAEKGTLFLTPHGKIHKVKVKEKGKTLRFKWQGMVVKWDSKLTTPFNPTASKISGIVEIPIYWAANDNAREFLDTYAIQSLSQSGISSEMPSSTRSLSGSGK